MARGDIWTGALVGYTASRAMDAATTWFHGRQSEASRRREEELAPGGALVQVAKQLGAAVGRELDDETAARVGLGVHRGFGIGYGMLAAALAQRGMPPLRAGLVVGAGALLLVDEGTSLSQARDYPIESHARGVVGHATLGLVTGVLLRLTGR